MDTLNNCILSHRSEAGFRISSPPGTDYFIDLHANVKKANAPFYYERVDFDFEIRVYIKPHFKSTYDAGAILILEDEEHWIKAAFEKTDLGYPAAVSVVTREASDDCNGERIDEEDLFLRVLRRGDYFAIHHSRVGTDWKMLRYFYLPLTRKVMVGVMAQSPLGKGVDVDFSDLVITENRYRDLRSGK